MTSHKRQLPKDSQQRLIVSPLTHASIPPPPQYDIKATALPWLYSSILGNGRLLVCLDETGSIAQLFYPHIDAGPHIRSFLLGIQLLGNDQAGESTQENVSWLAAEGWAHKLHYTDSLAPVVLCTSINTSLGLRVEQSMFVHSDLDVFISEMQVTNLREQPIACRLVVYAGFDFDSRSTGNTCLFHNNASALLFFAADRYVALSCDAPVQDFTCDKTSLDRPDSIFQEASAGRFTGNDYGIGLVSGAISFDFGSIAGGATEQHSLYLCCARSLDDVSMLGSAMLASRPKPGETIASWQSRYPHVQLEAASPVISTLYNRSLMVLRLLTDASTGGIIAAPEVDPDFRSSGGYGMCWPRDGAFAGHALDTAGQHVHARAFYDWALRVQSPSGVWYQRYYVTGQLAPTWGLIQFDETGALVWAICRHIQFTDDIAYGQKVFPQLLRACEYMHSSLDPETGLAPMTRELWEERDGINTYACASTWGGFHALSELASMLGNTPEAARWASAAAHLKSAIETHLWNATHRRFLRGLHTKVAYHDIERLRRQPDFSENDITEAENAGRRHYFLRQDTVVDISILGLSIPFGVFSPHDPRLLSTAEAIMRELASPIGGIRRYQHDPYRGGNPWIICTLWLALQDLAAGNRERALHLYNWTLEHRTPLDLLPEQVDNSTGQPCWVVPLAWSHAMFLLATRALLS